MKAVITGDIVKSSYISEPAKLIKSLKLILNEMDQLGIIERRMWEIFRGDSFQLVTAPEKALLASLVLRSGLQGGVYRLAPPLIVEDMLNETMDVRLSIGIGAVGELSDHLSESYGAAFTISGKMLEYIARDELKLLITTTDESLNKHFEVICRLTDIIISDWSENSSQAVYRNLLMDETQQETAGFLGISQSSVQNRLKIAHLDEIHHILAYFEEQIGAFTASKT
ncbi:MAG: hypothetical protein WD052_07135 [Bacteroidales bacterium]